MANTIANILKKLGLPFSCFSCKHDNPDLTPGQILPTLSSRLAKHNKGYCDALLDLLRSPNDVDVLTGDINEQFELLFRKPLSTTDIFEPHIIVIDALNESGSAEEQRALATCLLALVHATPWIKAFVTSRPEPSIRDTFLSDVESWLQVNIDAEKQTGSYIK